MKPANAYFSLIEEKLSADYAGMFRESGGSLKYPFLTPGSDQYADVLWDWDSWLSNIALRQILSLKQNSLELTKSLLLVPKAVAMSSGFLQEMPGKPSTLK
jgi:putative isomerase